MNSRVISLRSEPSECKRQNEARQVTCYLSHLWTAVRCSPSFHSSTKIPLISLKSPVLKEYLLSHVPCPLSCLCSNQYGKASSCIALYLLLSFSLYLHCYHFRLITILTIVLASGSFKGTLTKIYTSINSVLTKLYQVDTSLSPFPR